jgi:hypothetical protein
MKLKVILAALLILVTGCSADDYSEYTSLPAPVTSKNGETLAPVYLTTPPIYVSVPDVTTPTTTKPPEFATGSSDFPETTTNLLDLFSAVPIEEYYGTTTSDNEYGTDYTSGGDIRTDFPETSTPADSDNSDSSLASGSSGSPFSGGGAYTTDIFSPYGYRVLSKNQQELYSLIVKNIASMPEDIPVGELEVSADDYQIVYNLLRQEDPRFFFLSDEIRANQYAGKNILASLKPVYIGTKEEISSASEKIEIAANEIVSKAAGMSEYDKAVFFYESIIDLTEYELVGDWVTDIYGVFINKSAQCQGISKAFKYLCNKAGLECFVTTGFTGTGEAHMWNLVRVNGNWYHIDLSLGNTDSFYTKYSYCLIDDVHIYGNYTRDYSRTAPPAANSMSDNWYIKNGLYSKSSDEAMLIFKRALLSGTADRKNCIQIMIDDPEQFKLFAEAVKNPESADSLPEIYKQVNITAENKIALSTLEFSQYDDEYVFLVFPRYE